jgi:hypothetical protein
MDLGMGWSLAGGSVTHTIFARDTAKAIGWETNGFQYEVGFASLGIGLAGIYAANVGDGSAWVVASLAGGIFLLLAGFNHIVEIVRDRNYAPGNTAILISDLGVPISLLALLFATGANLGQRVEPTPRARRAGSGRSRARRRRPASPTRPVPR